VPTPNPRRRAAGALAAVVAALAIAVPLTAAPASAAATSTLLYSVDDGATWSGSVTAAPGQVVQVRHWFDNDGASSETGATIETEVPEGFSLVPWTTQVCRNPSTTDPLAPDDAELACLAVDEDTAWVDDALTISPGAGQGESIGSPSGTLAFGRVRYLNLHQCWYWNPSDTHSMYAIGTAFTGTGRDAGTNVSNVADASPTCGSGSAGATLLADQTASQPIEISTARYLNWSQCRYSSTQNDFYTVGTAFEGVDADAGTTSTNEEWELPECGTGGDLSFNGLNSMIDNFDLTAGRYLNLHQCHYWSSSRTAATVSTGTAYSGTARDAGTNVSDTVDVAPACGPGDAAAVHIPGNSGVDTFDTLDASRGRGYVAYAMVAPADASAATCAATPTPGTEAFDQEGTLTTDQSGTVEHQATATVDWTLHATDACAVALGIPMADPAVAAVVALAVAAGGGWWLARRRAIAA
jgi:hypothetical protein